MSSQKIHLHSLSSHVSSTAVQLWPLYYLQWRHALETWACQSRCLTWDYATPSPAAPLPPQKCSCVVSSLSGNFLVKEHLPTVHGSPGSLEYETFWHSCVCVMLLFWFSGFPARNLLLALRGVEIVPGVQGDDLRIIWCRHWSPLYRGWTMGTPCTTPALRTAALNTQLHRMLVPCVRRCRVSLHINTCTPALTTLRHQYPTQTLDSTKTPRTSPVPASTESTTRMGYSILMI